jgi:hypothetical protein
MRFGKHLPTNIVLDIDGDRATAWSSVLYVIPGAEPRIAFLGQYDDAIRRVDGVWRFERRCCTAAATQ